MLIKAGEIIKNSWQIYAENFKKLLAYMLLLFIPNFILGLSGFFSLYLDKYATSDYFVLINNVIIVVIFVASIVFTLWAALAMTKNLGSLAANKGAVNWREALSSTSHLIWPVIYTSLLVMLIVLGGTILFIIPGIIFSIWYTFTYYAIIFEEKKGTAALTVSKSLVVGRWWSILWRVLAPAVFYSVILLIINYSITYGLAYLLKGFSYVVVNGVLTSVISALISPLTALTIVLLYFSAKENPAPIKQ
ncbi:MAG: hypothetical protein PHD72_04790 [Patescibacteria group bacterium]|nr:hypothetical protein [Patescibacteria group bacterium]